MHNALRLVLFAGVLLLAAYLRITGLTWGLNSGYGHERNFQPDEFVSLRGLLQLDLLAGRIKAPGAYFEGTFNYYLWALPKAVLRIAGEKDVNLSNSITRRAVADLLYVCRWMSVLFDLCTIVVVFLAIMEATKSFSSSLLGALCYALLPMEVIYAHFMRPHILSNLLCALVIWLSLKLRRSQAWHLLVAVGLLAGLGAATRYPVGIIVLIPCLSLLLNTNDDMPNWKVRTLRRIKDFAARQVWLIGLGFGVGLFLGHPMLFIDPAGVTAAITGETLKYASLHEFSASRLMNLSVIWRYITYLLPFAMYPFMWLAAYCVILYLIFRRTLWSLSAPILIFCLLYLYFMGKGYLGPYFARVTMLLFPGFCILVGIACGDLQLRLTSNRTLKVLLTGVFLVVLLPSVLFDIAYGRAMQQTDVRQVVQEDLQKLIGQAPTTIGVSPYGPYFCTVMPAVRLLNNEKVTVQLQDSGQDADFFLLGLTRQIDSVQLSVIVRHVEAQQKFEYEKSYNVPVQIFGYKFNLGRFPQDMTYPFTTILLFRART